MTCTIRMSKKIDKQLIEKYLDDNCSPEERDAVLRFLQRPESEILLNEILEARSANDWQLFQDDNATSSKHQHWQNSINERIHPPSSRFRSTTAGKPFFMRYAAVWITLISVAVGIYGLRYFNENKPQVTIAYQEASNPYGQRSRLILSDSTVIYLGAGSRIRYPEHFTGDTREISLSGEAFFDVTKNPKKPFIIHTGNIQTTVLGTSFKIEAFKDHPIAVEVVTGKVRVDHFKQNHILSLAVLTPGQTVTWDKGKAAIGQVVIDEVNLWKDAKLVFNDSSLAEIAEELQRFYNLDIRFKNTAKSKERMTVTLDASVSADKLLNVLAAAGHFNYKIKNGQVIIR